MANPSEAPPPDAPLRTPAPNQQLSNLQSPNLQLTCVARFPNTRVLAWDGDVLYASRGYELVRCRISDPSMPWEHVADFNPAWWRKITSSTRLGFRLVRDGFHALAVLPSGELIAALPGAIATLRPGEKEFRVTHAVQRGTRPLNLAVTPDGRVFWGEYFDNPTREAVHVYGSEDRGASWKVVYSFEQNAIRHIHNIVYDQWGGCFWVLTGDIGDECRVLRASLDWTRVESVISGNQQARAVAAVSKEDGLYFASDTPLEQNYLYRLDRRGNLAQLAKIHASVLCGGAVREAVFFTTMIEPSLVNLDRTVAIYGSNGGDWERLLIWKKDRWSEKLFQYGNAFVATGYNATNLLAVTTIAVESHDIEASFWELRLLN